MATATEQTFQQFLQELAREQGGQEVLARRREWVAAVERLLEQLTAWLREADAGKVLEIDRTEVERAEAGLGRYTAPGLSVGVGRVRSQVAAVGRNTRHLPASLAVAVAHATGRVDDFERAWTPAGQVEVSSRFDRWSLFRLLGPEAAEDWWAFKSGATASEDQAGRLTKAMAETVFRDVLS